MARYTLQALHQKYHGFRAPTARVTVGGNTMHSYGWAVTAVECETSVFSEAGTCVVTLGGIYERKNSRFLCDGLLVRGMPVQVQLGYVVTAPVFSGFLYEIAYLFDERSAPYVQLICMDVKAAMMGGGILDFSGGLTYRQVIQSFFSGSHARGYSALCSCPDLSLPELEQPVSHLPGQMDDYGFLQHTAQRFGLEFFVSEGDLVLRKEPAAPERIVDLSPEGGVRRLEVRLRSAGYVKSVCVWGGSADIRDGEKKRASATAENTYAITGGNALARRLLGQRALHLFAPSAHDDKTAGIYAQSQLRQSNLLCSELEAELFGLPDLKPGFSLGLAKVSPGLNGAWYITAVSHRLDEEGFSTTVRGRRKL